MAHTSPMDSHHAKQMLENIEFLESVGLHRDHIARRLGFTVAAMEKAIRRAQKKASQCEVEED